MGCAEKNCDVSCFVFLSFVVLFDVNTPLIDEKEAKENWQDLSDPQKSTVWVLGYISFTFLLDGDDVVVESLFWAYVTLKWKGFLDKKSTFLKTSTVCWMDGLFWLDQRVVFSHACRGLRYLLDKRSLIEVTKNTSFFELPMSLSLYNAVLLICSCLFLAPEAINFPPANYFKEFSSHIMIKSSLALFVKLS